MAGGVKALAQQTITTQGTVSASTVATNIAINGDGFFDVQKPTGTVDNTPTFNGVTDYTRAGDFQVNANGYLVNSAGYYLMGVAVDPKTGNPLGSVPTVLQFNNNFVPAQATTAIQYAANLPTVPVTTASPNAPTGRIVAKGGLNPADFSQNPGSSAHRRRLSAMLPWSAIVVIGREPRQITATTALITADQHYRGVHYRRRIRDQLLEHRRNLDHRFARRALHHQRQCPTTGTPPGATVGDLLSAIDTINGNTSLRTISTSGTAGEITLNTGTAANLVITDNNSNAVFSQLGFSADPAATRTGGGSTVPARWPAPM